MRRLVLSFRIPISPEAATAVQKAIVRYYPDAVVVETRHSRRQIGIAADDDPALARRARHLLRARRVRS